MNDDFDRLLRDTLENEAQSYEPSGDGLTRIRARIGARRARLRWLVPSLALAAAAAGVASVIVLPTLLPSPTPNRPPATQPASPSSSSEPSTEPSSPASTTSPAPGQLPDLVTVWPYASRREAASRAPADVTSGRLPYLADARKTALHFVQDFVGVKGPMQVVRTGALEAGVGVTLGRKNPNGKLFDVTTVYLVRVAQGDAAPYVVVRADAPGLRVTGATPRSTGAVAVSGRVVGIHQSVQVRLLDKDGKAVVEGFDGAAGEERPWGVVLGSAAKPVPAGRYALAAQTSSDADGFISELVVRAYTQP